MSKIDWTERTWNPVVGCSKVSQGCKNCYAEKMAIRLENNPNVDSYDGVINGKRWTGKVRELEDKIDQPKRWRKPSVIFCNSMSDLFHPEVSDDFIKKCFQTMLEADRHTYQILTKRPERPANIDWNITLPNHIWMGTSVESGEVKGRIDSLRQVDCDVRFLSVEPLIGPMGNINLNGIDWVIVGGESGPGARDMDLDWAREVRDQCIESDTAFYLKQLGGVRDKKNGDDAVLDGRTWTQMPEITKNAGINLRA